MCVLYMEVVDIMVTVRRRNGYRDDCHRRAPWCSVPILAYHVWGP